jgi:type I restriction enzyme S subunit
MRDFTFRLPPINEQKQISKVLGDLDDKIAINSQINQLLESMAQTIFKSWFVDFEPVKAKIAAIKAGEDAEGVTRVAMRAISGKTDDELDQMQARQPENYAQLKTTAELFPAAMQDSELGEVLEGWKIGILSDLIDFNPKRTLKKGVATPYLDMKNVPTTGHLALWRQ